MCEYYKKFSLRTATAFFFLLLGAAVCIVRVFIAATDGKMAAAAANQSSVKLDLYPERGNIFDENMQPLTGAESEWVTVFLPNAKGVTAASVLLKGEEKAAVLERLKSKKPARILRNSGNVPGTVSLEVPKRYSQSCRAAHLVGYIDGEGYGVSGLEAGFDSMLYKGEYAGINISTSASGEALGVMPQLITPREDISDLVLTLNGDIQSLAENELKKITAGAAVVLETNGEIKAMASTPSFDPNSPEKSLSSPDSPFLNRALANYSVGSVFKIVTAAAAIESGISPDTEFQCCGSLTVDGVKLYCHKKDGHGTVNMQTAIAESCNCYFYRLAMQTGAAAILDIAGNCGLAGEQNICAGISVPPAVLPNGRQFELSQPALCNFAIGQGTLSASPAAMAAVYGAVLNGGVSASPYLVKGRLSADGFESLPNDSRTAVVMSKKTADILKGFLISALRSGTGSGAYSESVVSGGKTATAQTGQKQDGREKNNGWFCGFFVTGGKTFIVAVMAEDCDMQKTTCSEIFKNISEQVAKMY